MKTVLTPLTIRLVFRICLLFIIGPIVPAPDRLWNQAFVDIPLRISPKRSHEAPLYRPCMTNFITRPLPIANYVISTQWGRITSQFPLLSRVKQSITAVDIERMCRLHNDYYEHTVHIKKALPIATVFEKSAHHDNRRSFPSNCNFDKLICQFER